MRYHGFPLRATLKLSTSITSRNSAFKIGCHSGPINKLSGFGLALFHPKMRFTQNLEDKQNGIQQKMVQYEKKLNQLEEGKDKLRDEMIFDSVSAFSRECH